MREPADVEVEGLDAGDMKAIQLVLEGVRKDLRCGLVGVEVCGVGPGDSRSLNRRYRGKDKVATVLSFSLPSVEPGGMAGQVLLCPVAVRREALSLGIPYRRWLVELCIHGFLHILGHRHDDSVSAGLMFSTQRALLNMARGR